MLSFLACLLVVSLYVLPYYLLPFQVLRGHRDAASTIRARALCSFGSCAAISALLFAVVAARLRSDDEDFGGGGGDGDRHERSRRLVEARLALSDPSAWLRASFPLWAVRSLAPALAEALASFLGAGRAAASAWRTAAAEAADEALRLRLRPGGGASPPAVPSPAAATLRLLGLSPPSAAAPGALVGFVSLCCLLAWPLSQRAVEAAFGGGARREGKQRWWRLLFRRSKRGDIGAEVPYPSSPSLLRRLVPQATTLRDLVIAPLTEEIAFRGCLLPALLLLLPATATSRARALAASSAAFASAHLHHAAATLLLSPTRLPRGQSRAVALGALLQLIYTFAFGAAAGALLLASGSLAAPVAAHSLANFLGLPRRRKSGSGSPPPSPLLRRIEGAVGALGVAAFALMAAGCGGGQERRSGFVPFAGLASRVGAAAPGQRYRLLAAALSLPPPQ